MTHFKSLEQRPQRFTVTTRAMRRILVTAVQLFSWPSAARPQRPIHKTKITGDPVWHDRVAL
jgi:hypothetical protein